MDELLLEKIDRAIEDAREALAKDTMRLVSIKSVKETPAPGAPFGAGPKKVLDTVLDSKKGICFDYAALMCGMLRSQGVPCKLVVGYAGTTYHAWISVWSEQSGWIDGVIWFDGTAWRRLDPTFASSGGSSKSILDFINKDENYTVKYLY